MNHSNIAKLIEFFIDKNKKTAYIIMEKCKGKSLQKLLEKNIKFTGN
jgi:serine/threonine protein kinase